MNMINRRGFIRKSTGSLFSLAIAGKLTGNNLSIPSWTEFSLQESLNSLQEKLAQIKPKHPSLHFNADGLRELRKKAVGTHQRYAEQLYKWVELNKSWSPPLITGFDGDEVQLEESAAFITNMALAYCLSRKKEYLDLTREWAQEMCKYPKDAIRNYGIGIYAAGLARTYDWLYHDLEPSQRETIKKALLDIVSRMYEGTLPGAAVPMWWAKAYMHHDHWIAAGGFGEASLAILGEVDDSCRYAAYAKLNFDTILSWLSDDGAWHEGAADWCYAMAPLLWFYGAWETVAGENLHDTPWIKNTGLYRLYHWLPDDSYIYLDDSFRSGRYSTSGGASCHLLRRLASLFQDGHLQWLADRDEIFDLKPSPKGVYQAPYEKLSFTGEPKEYPNPVSQCVSWNILWYDPAIKAIPPDNLPVSKHFENQGITIMRTGWNNNETVVSFTCAPLSGHLCAQRMRNGEKIVRNFYSHAHLDFNSFTLFANGQYFIIPAGYARRTSSFQNVISVNGANFIADPASGMKLTAFICKENFSYAVGDATEAFITDLGVKKYLRHILLFENNWLVILDDLDLDAKTATNRGYKHFKWTVHNDPNSHAPEISGRHVSWRSSGNHQPALSMLVLEPREFACETGILQSTRGKNMMEAVRITKSEWGSDKMQVLTIWSWHEMKEVPSLIKTNDYIGAFIGETKGIVFNMTDKIPSEFPDKDFKDREILFLGFDTRKADSFAVIRDGKILK